MNKKIKKLLIIAVMLFACGVNIKAQSTVYFFVDFRFWNDEYVFSVNGEEAFKLVPEGKPVVSGSDVMMYNMVARKVEFKNPDNYVVATDCPTKGGILHAELNLHLEDGGVYYVLVNSTLKRSFYMEILNDKDGSKLLEKAQKNKKYTFNEDFVYDNR